MSMTLEQAIEHVEMTYKESRNGLQYALKRGETRFAERCKKEAEEHRQLAEWLRELQERRKAPEIIFCKNCTRRRKNTETGEYYCRASGLRNTDYDFCSGGKRPEGRTDADD